MSRIASIFVSVALAGLLTGCGPDQSKMTDAQLGLDAQQSRGRRVYAIYCINCHPAYSSRGNNGPAMKGLYKKEYLPSGLTPTDEHVEECIVRGRKMMPRFGDQLNQQEITDLIAYLHTL